MVRLTMTEKGRRAYKQSLPKEVRATLSSLSEEERQQLWSRLETLRSEALKQVGKDPKKVPLPEFL